VISDVSASLSIHSYIQNTGDKVPKIVFSFAISLTEIVIACGE